MGYVDDIIRTARQSEIDNLVERANKLDPDLLQFTMEKERDGVLPFLDIKIVRTGFSLVTDWYNKPTDTGLFLNFHALAPTKY